MQKTSLPELVKSLSDLSDYLKITNAKDSDVLSKFKAFNFSSGSLLEEIFQKGAIEVKDKNVFFSKIKMPSAKAAKKGRTEKYLESYEQKIQFAHKNFDYVVFTDGSCDNVSKEYVRYGYVIYKDGKPFDSLAEEDFNIPLKERTSNTAECIAVMKAANSLLKKRLENKKIMFFSDSEFTLNYLMNTGWSNGDPNKGYFNSWSQLRKILPKFTNVKKAWIPREKNQEADNLTR